MAEFSRRPSREEEEFWDAQFRDPARPRRARRDTPPLPRREHWRALAAESSLSRVTERLADRLRDWRHDARFGVVLLIGVALVAGVIWYRIGIGGASAGESGAAPAPRRTPPPSTPPARAPATTRG